MKGRKSCNCESEDEVVVSGLSARLFTDILIYI